MIDMLLLGTGGMQPLPDRWLSSVLLRVDGHLILFDCGEGTQIPWKQFGWGFRRLSAICVSHNHADHIAGLPGLLHTVANAGRTDPMLIYGPVGTRAVVAGLRVIAPELPFTVNVHELAGGEVFALPAGLTGACYEGDHPLPVLAYRVALERKPRFDPDRAAAMKIPRDLWRPLQKGRSVSWAGGYAVPDDVLGAPRKGIAFAYVTDTRPVAGLAEFIDGADLLVCEGTYGADEDQEKAIRNSHLTFREAATIARDADVERLWLTHFGAGMTDPATFLRNASVVFPNTTLGYSGLTATLRFGGVVTDSHSTETDQPDDPAQTELAPRARQSRTA